MERTSPDQAAALKQPLSDINTRWDELLKGIVERQRELDHALLRLGQFQHALDELLVWIGRTDKTLDGLRPVLGDPQVWMYAGGSGGRRGNSYSGTST